MQAPTGLVPEAERGNPAGVRGGAAPVGDVLVADGLPEAPGGGAVGVAEAADEAVEHGPQERLEPARGLGPEAGEPLGALPHPRPVALDAQQRHGRDPAPRAPAVREVALHGAHEHHARHRLVHLGRRRERRLHPVPEVLVPEPPLHQLRHRVRHPPVVDAAARVQVRFDVQVVLLLLLLPFGAITSSASASASASTSPPTASATRLALCVPSAILVVITIIILVVVIVVVVVVVVFVVIIIGY